jgi:hypothetical protein
MRGTLTLSNSISAHTLIYTTILYKPYTIAILKYRRPLLPKKYIRIIVFTFKLQRTFFSRKTMFLRRSNTIKLLLLIILINGSYPNLRGFQWPGKSSSALCLLSRANSCRVATPIGTSDRSDHQSWLVRNSYVIITLLITAAAKQGCGCHTCGCGKSWQAGRP